MISTAVIEMASQLTEKDVKSAMTSPVVTVDVESTVVEASKFMAEKSIGCVVVTDKDVPVGIITERDIVRRIVAAEKDSRRTKVSQCLSSPLVTISSRETLEKAGVRMFEHGVRRLVVLDEGRLVGIITSSDLARFLVGIETQDKMLLRSIARYHEKGY